MSENWSRNVRYAAKRILRPSSIDEARDAVASSTRIRALGTRHTFNAIADTPGDLISLAEVPIEPRLSDDGRTVIVGAATPYGTVARFLQERGLALHNLGSLPHISVGGACSTGTHGSGDGNGILATAVDGLEFITASGDLVSVTRETHPATFAGMVVALGALGIVTRIALRTHPTYDVRQDVYLDLPWDVLLDRFDDVTAQAFSVNVFTRWAGDTVPKVWLKSRVDGALPDAAATLLGARLDGPGEKPTLKNYTVGHIAGPWNERLPHFVSDLPPSHGDELQTEYLVPRTRIREALVAMRAMGERLQPLLLNSEIRTMRGDELWLSPAYGRDSVGVHFTWKNDVDAVEDVLPDVEAALLPLESRPHWGKLFAAGAADIAPLYPRMHDFAALVAEWDPDGKFHNEFLEKHAFARTLVGDAGARA